MVLDLNQIAAQLRRFQLPNGLVLQTPNGIGDPWNHVEVLMAFTVAGDFEAAQSGYRWLRDHQLGDGSWFHYYRTDCVHSSRIDFNVIGYLATGLFQYWRITADRAFIDEMWPTLERALRCIEAYVDDAGYVPWSIDSRGRTESFSLLTGSSSLLHSLLCANKLAEELGQKAAIAPVKLSGLRHRVKEHQNRFANKREFAMDWYYPSLCGAVSLTREYRQKFEDLFLVQDFGVRCVSNSEWVTTAETAEYALTLAGVGELASARELLSGLEKFRAPEGLFYTGIGHESGRTFPLHEVSSYSAAAVVLAMDAIEKISPAHDILTSHARELGEFSCSLC